MVECLTRDRGVATSRLTGVTALCHLVRQINPYLVLVQPRHNWKKVDWGIKNQIKQKKKKKFCESVLCIPYESSQDSDSGGLTDRGIEGLFGETGRPETIYTIAIKLSIFHVITPLKF